MFDKLEDLRIRLDEILNELQEPDVANDQNRFRKLMKEQNDLTPIVEAYKEYKNCKQTVEVDNLLMIAQPARIVTTRANQGRSTVMIILLRFQILYLIYRGKIG